MEIDKNSELYKKLTTFEFKITEKGIGMTLVAETQDFITREGIAPSVRQIYYYLLSKGLITHKHYNAIDELMVDARKKGHIRWEDIREETRTQRRASCHNDLVSYLTECRDKYYYREIFRKGFQNNFIIIFLEKDALSDIVFSAVGRYFVPVIVTRGFNSWGGFYQLIEKHFKNLFPPDVFNWKVLSLYDFDPYGLEQFELLKEQFNHFFGFNRIVPELIALKEEQVIDKVTGEFKLPTIPQPTHSKTTKKLLKRKSVLEWLKRRPWRCELDALTPTQLKSIVESEVKKYLDLKAYNLEWEKWRLEKRFVHIQQRYPNFTSELEQASSVKDLRKILGKIP